MKGPKFGLTDLLDYQQLEEASSELEAPAPNPLRPSSAGKCTRELAFALNEHLGHVRYKHVPREPSVTRLFSLGHSVEANLIEHFKKSCGHVMQVKYQQQTVQGFEITSDTVPALNGRIEGSIDLYLEGPDFRALVDIKSKKIKFSNYHRDSWEEVDEMLLRSGLAVPIGESTTAYWVEDLDRFVQYLETEGEPFFAPNFWQLNFYAHSDFILSKNIDFASILQYDKNSSRLREIRVAPSQKLYERTRHKFQTAVDAAVAGDPLQAPQDFALGSIRCGFCPYKDACWEQDAKQAYFEAEFPRKNFPKDVGRLPGGAQIEALYAQFSAAQGSVKQMEAAERQIVAELLARRIYKVRFSDGHVYSLKLYKSPREHFRLKRGK